MVHLWTNAPECGIGFVGPTDAFAYSANGGPCLTAFVLAHEVSGPTLFSGVGGTVGRQPALLIRR